MSIYAERVEKQSPKNQSIYYAWLDECDRLGKKGMNSYKGAVTEFFEYNGDCSVLEIKIETIDAFLKDRKIKPSYKRR